MGENQALKELWESDISDKRKFVILARFHKIKMQAEILKDNSISYTHEKIEAETPEKNCTSTEKDREKRAKKRREGTHRCKTWNGNWEAADGKIESGDGN